VSVIGDTLVIEQGDRSSNQRGGHLGRDGRLLAEHESTGAGRTAPRRQRKVGYGRRWGLGGPFGVNC